MTPARGPSRVEGSLGRQRRRSGGAVPGANERRPLAQGDSCSTLTPEIGDAARPLGRESEPENVAPSLENVSRKSPLASRVGWLSV
jgi:hypothetical protein